MAYRIYNNNRFATRDGVVNSGSMYSPDVDGGALKMYGSSEAYIRASRPNQGQNLNPTLVTNKNISAGQYGSAVTVTTVTSGNGVQNLFELRITGTLGVSSGSLINLTDTTGILVGPARVVTLTSTSGFTVNRGYVAGVATVTYAPIVGRLGHMDIRNYTMKRVSSNVHGQSNTTLRSGAADYGRNSVHKVNAIRTRKVATAIRAGYWNPFTGTFSTAPTNTSDYASFDNDGSDVPDDEVKRITSTGYAFGGEISYRTGKPTVISGQYDSKNT